MADGTLFETGMVRGTGSEVGGEVKECWTGRWGGSMLPNELEGVEAVRSLA